MNKTKIILQKDIPNLGVTGDVMDVAHGYARNYLLPRKLASMATKRTLAKVDEQKQKLVQDNQKKLSDAQDEAKKIQEVVVILQSRAGDDGKLFGSVTSADVAHALAEKGFPIDRRWVEIQPIRATGDFTAAVRLHPQVRAVFKIQVTALTH